MNRTPLHARAALAATTLAVLTACGGGGGDPPTAQAPLGPNTGPLSRDRPESAAGAPVSTPAGTPTAPSPSTPVAVSPDPAGGSSWPATEAPTNPTPVGTDPPPSGRSLNWWGTEPTLLFDTQNNCTPQPECRIPDGDLAVWNRQCPPEGNPYRAQCYVPLSFEQQVRPEERRPLGPPPGATRPDPLTATQQEIDLWNSYCLTPRCLVVAGRLP